VHNRLALQAVVPDGRLEVFSYPLDGPNLKIKRQVGEHFVCCRGGGQTSNTGTIDLNLLNAYFLDWRSWNRLDCVREVIEQNISERGWLIFATHDVVAEPSRYGCSAEFFNQVVRLAVDSGARVLPVMKACQELKITSH
jgi:hypothetical protein